MDVCLLFLMKSRLLEIGISFIILFITFMVQNFILVTGLYRLIREFIKFINLRFFTEC